MLIDSFLFFVRLKTYNSITYVDLVLKAIRAKIARRLCAVRLDILKISRDGGWPFDPRV